MVTMVGTQSDFEKALKELVELDYDAVEAYETAIHRLENKRYKQKLEAFKKDHERHIEELSRVLEKHGVEPPTGPSLGKQWLAKGKVVLGTLVGDEMILTAMHSNEEDTNTAYQRMIERNDQWDDTIDILQRGLADERRHKAWLESPNGSNAEEEGDEDENERSDRDEEDDMDEEDDTDEEDYSDEEDEDDEKEKAFENV